MFEILKVYCGREFTNNRRLAKNLDKIVQGLIVLKFHKKDAKYSILGSTDLMVLSPQ
jgi:hypothetical protein